MSANPDEKTTIDEDLDKDIKTTNNIDTKEELNQSSEIDNQDNEIRRRLRKNPKKTVLLYSAENLNKFEKKKKVIPTDLTDEDIKLFKEIIEKLKSNKKSYYFRTSPLKQFETKEDKQIYRSIVTHPMDLAHILTKINKQKYITYQDFYNDIILIWDNAQLFNLVGSVFYEDAEAMRIYTEKLFKEKKIDDKVIHKEKKIEQEDNNNNENDENNDNNNDKENNDENNNENIEEENNEEINSEEKESTEKNFVGRKRKKSDEDYNEESDKDNNNDEGEIESNPIINIKNSDNENPSPKNKKNGKNSNSNNANNQIKKSPSNKSSQNNEKKLENILENMGDKNDKNDKNQNQEEKEMNNSNDSDNNKENDTNNNYIENDDDAYLEEYKKKQHEIKLSEELIKSYSYKIAKKLDKLNDEDMFDLIEFIERIKPDAIDDTGNLLNIDMTKFEGETYISVLNFVENAILNNSMYK